MGSELPRGFQILNAHVWKCNCQSSRVKCRVWESEIPNCTYWQKGSKRFSDQDIWCSIQDGPEAVFLGRNKRICLGWDGSPRLNKNNASGLKMSWFQAMGCSILQTFPQSDAAVPMWHSVESCEGILASGAWKSSAITRVEPYGHLPWVLFQGGAHSCP